MNRYILADVINLSWWKIEMSQNITRCDFPECRYPVKKYIVRRYNREDETKEGLYCLLHAGANNDCQQVVAKGREVCFLHTCAAPGCQGWVDNNSMESYPYRGRPVFCATHSCVKDDCDAVRLDDLYFCYEHHQARSRKKRKRMIDAEADSEDQED